MMLFKRLADALWHALARRILPGPTLRIGSLDHTPDPPRRRTRRAPKQIAPAAMSKPPVAESGGG